MRPTLAFLAVAFAILLAGCGGGNKKKSSSSTTTHSSTSKKPVKPKSVSLKESVVVPGSKSGPSSSASVSAGGAVSFVTVVPGKRGDSPVKVNLDLTRESATKWTMSASVKKQKSVATVTSKNGKELKLVGLRYGCSLPPAPTFCPASHVNTSSTKTSVRFSAAPASSITLGATVGPTPNAPVLTPPSTLVAPTYTLVTTVTGIPKKRAKNATPTKPGPTASVHPGDIVQIRIGVTGSVVGAPQPLSLTFDQGPAKSLKVSASVPGGTTSTATISSANGHRIAIVTPRYNCYLPPYPTFCPASHIKAQSHKYALTVNALPKVAVAISGVAQAG